MPREGDVVAVLHRDPGRYSHFIDALGHDDYYYVGRSMFETDSIPEGAPPFAPLVHRMASSRAMAVRRLTCHLSRQVPQRRRPRSLPSRP